MDDLARIVVKYGNGELYRQYDSLLLAINEYGETIKLINELCKSACIDKEPLIQLIKGINVRIRGVENIIRDRVSRSIPRAALPIPSLKKGDGYEGLLGRYVKASNITKVYISEPLLAKQEHFDNLKMFLEFLFAKLLNLQVILIKTKKCNSCQDKNFNKIIKCLNEQYCAQIFFFYGPTVPKFIVLGDKRIIRSTRGIHIFGPLEEPCDDKDKESDCGRPKRTDDDWPYPCEINPCDDLPKKRPPPPPPPKKGKKGKKAKEAQGAQGASKNPQPDPKAKDQKGKDQKGNDPKNQKETDQKNPNDQKAATCKKDPCKKDPCQKDPCQEDPCKKDPCPKKKCKKKPAEGEPPKGEPAKGKGAKGQPAKEEPPKGKGAKEEPPKGKGAKEEPPKGKGAKEEPPKEEDPCKTKCFNPFPKTGVCGSEPIDDPHAIDWTKLIQCPPEPPEPVEEVPLSPKEKLLAQLSNAKQGKKRVPVNIDPLPRKDVCQSKNASTCCGNIKDDGNGVVYISSIQYI